MRACAVFATCLHEEDEAGRPQQVEGVELRLSRSEGRLNGSQALSDARHGLLLSAFLAFGFWRGVFFLIRRRLLRQIRIGEAPSSRSPGGLQC